MTWGAVTIGTAVGGFGLSAYSAFSGGGGASPSSVVKLDDTDQGMFNKVHGEYKDWRKMATKGQFFPNLATPVLSQLKKQAQDASKQTSSGMRSLASQKNTEGATSTGKQVGAGLMGFGLNYQTGTAESKAKGEMQREQFLGVLKQGQNFQNIERQVPLLNAQAQYAKSAQSQMNSIAQGQFLGGLAELGGMMYYSKKTGGKLLP